MNNHVCVSGSKPLGALDGPAWASPGRIVKVAGQDRWGRVRVLRRCCGMLEVEFDAFAEHRQETLCLTADALENAFGDYPANLPPRGYPIPVRE